MGQVANCIQLRWLILNKINVGFAMLLRQTQRNEKCIGNILEPPLALNLISTITANTGLQGNSLHTTPS